MFDVYVGYDSRESEAFQVCQQSLVRRSSVPLDIHALRLDVLRNSGMMRRPQKLAGDLYYTESDDDPFEQGIRKTSFDEVDQLPFSTEFSFTRFLVPHLQKTHGGSQWALFCDCDFLFLEDVKKLFDQADDQYAVMVVKHDHKPRNQTKMDGQQQVQYYRKNWSSLILWNCTHPGNRRLTLDKVNTEMGRYLHAFMWLRDEEIGDLPEEWNFLVGHSEGTPKALHYTEGGPWFEEHQDCDYAAEWWREAGLKNQHVIR